MDKVGLSVAEMVDHMMVSHQAAALGLVLDGFGRGEAAMSAPWRAELVGDPETDVIASGVVTTLLDHVCAISVLSLFDEFRPMATLDLRIDYMRPAGPGCGVTARANCYKLTRTIGFVRAQAWDTDPADLVATAQAVFVTNQAKPR